MAVPADLLSDPDWVNDCLFWRGRVLMGRFAHWCDEWDGLPVDETMPEWPCGCFPDAPAADLEEDDGEDPQG